VELLERLFFVEKRDDDAQIGPLGLRIPLLLGTLLIGAPLLVLLLRGCGGRLGSFPGLGGRIGCLIAHRVGSRDELAVA
jgi:hypothetical protein